MGRQRFFQTLDTRKMIGNDGLPRQPRDSRFPVGRRKLRRSAHAQDKPFKMG